MKVGLNIQSPSPKTGVGFFIRVGHEKMKNRLKYLFAIILIFNSIICYADNDITENINLDVRESKSLKETLKITKGHIFINIYEALGTIGHRTNIYEAQTLLGHGIVTKTDVDEFLRLYKNKYFLISGTILQRISENGGLILEPFCSNPIYIKFPHKFTYQVINNATGEREVRCLAKLVGKYSYENEYGDEINTMYFKVLKEYDLHDIFEFGYIHDFCLEAHQHGYSNIADYLRDCKARIEKGQHKIELFDAARNGNIKIVRLLLDKGADVNAKDRSGKTAMILAAKNGHADIVRLLLDKGADVNAKADDDTTALMQAAEKGNVDVVRALLEKGADVNVRRLDGSTALMYAAKNDNVDAVRVLLDNGADVNATINSEGTTALIQSAINGYADVVRALLDKGADVNLTTIDGASALIEAAKNGHADVVRALIDKGADVNAEAWVGTTALIQAAINGHADVVRALLDKGADVNEKASVDNGTALNEAAINGHEDIVRILKAAGARE